MGKRQKRKTKKQKLIIKRKMIVCIFLCLLVSVIGYFILLTDFLKPQLNKLTTSYISFNNRNSTDMLRIDNLKKISDKKGVYLAGLNSLNFTIPKGKNLDYDIVLIPNNSEIENKYIHYVLSVDGKNEVKTLNTTIKNDNDEIIIYRGSNKDDTDISLYMWVSKKYKRDVENLSYEVKIKSR